MEPILPMEPQSSDTIPQGEDWIAQVKWDGVRVLTYYDGQRVRLFNRKLNERTYHYPELHEIRSYCNAQSVILDGEIVALGSDGKPSFHEVMRRDGIRRMEKVSRYQSIVPVTYMIFDIIFLNGEWLNRMAFGERMEILQKVIHTGDQVQLVASEPDGETLFEVIRQHDMEGIVLKQIHSPYLIGEKKDVWRKVKNYHDLIAVIGGFTLNGGIVNAILLGLYDEQGQLWYIGHTGTGKLTQQEWRELTDQLRPGVIRERPFVNKPERESDAYWVRPELTVKIQYAEWTEGRALRQPSIQSIVDVQPTECKIHAKMVRH